MIPPKWLSTVFVTVLLVGQGTVAQFQLNLEDPESIKSTAATTAYNMMAYYTGNETGQEPGKLPGTWWEGGAMFMTLIQYWFFTNDSSYNGVIQQGMYYQKGNNDFFPTKQSQYLGNDDQVFWGLAAMTAAEFNFPEKEDEPSWLSLAQGVFNTQISRWDTSTCDGGLRWQIWPYQPGYTIKNAISNGGLFQLAARLAYYTHNETYAVWAEKIWDWSAKTPLLKEVDWTIADTTSSEANCKDHGDIQWTYNYGTYVSGAGYMYNYTKGGEKWKKGVDGLLGTTFRQFFPPNLGNGTIMSEVACEPNQMCDRNQRCFKAFLSTWLAFLTTIAPYTTDEIIPKLKASALGAAQQCSGGDDKKHCGRRWYQEKWDGYKGLEEQMSALGIFSVQMITRAEDRNQAPLTFDTGGTSKSNPDAGNNADVEPDHKQPITMGDRAGAGIVTVVFMGGWIAAVTFMLWGG